MRGRNNMRSGTFHGAGFVLAQRRFFPKRLFGPLTAHGSRLAVTFLTLFLVQVGTKAPGAERVGVGEVVMHPDLEWSLFAAEPDVVDPVAMTFDEAGRAYVVEMRDYPYGFGPERKPGGTVRLLEDVDGDGHADKSTVFAEHLSFPTSIAAWNGGVLVAASPDIVFLKDTDGDGKSDLREVVLSGFHLGVTDSNVNGLRWGLDNWLHGANGGNGGRVRSSRGPNKAVDLGNRDFRFRPGTGLLDLTAQTAGGFGLVFDDWGRSFAPYNINHIQQRVADVDEFNRFPGLPPFETTQSISDHGEMARIYPVSTARTRPNHPEQAGYFSAAGGLGYIGHQGWPEDLAGSVLVCDVVGNLVHRDLLKPNGPIFTATRARGEETREFLASRDNNFRPVGLELGPDGALYLLDMQRDVIEHPDYIPARLREHLDLRAGENRGRIHRIAPRGWGHARELPAQASPRQLVVLLSSPNQWTRMTAQRLLVAGAGQSVVSELKRVSRNGKASRAQLHALWTLSGLGQLDEGTLLVALEDPSEGVRENALQLVRTRPVSTSVAAKVMPLLEDGEPRVRFQAALAAGALPQSISVLPALGRLLRRDHEYPWTRRAVLASLRSGEDVVLDRTLADAEFVAQAEPSRLAVVHELASLLAARLKPERGEAVTALLDRMSGGNWSEAWQRAVLDGLIEGFHRGGNNLNPDLASRRAMARWARASSRTLLAAAWRLQRALGWPEFPGQHQALASAIQAARDTGLAISNRIEAIRLLDLGRASDSVPVLLGLLDGREPSLVQETALDRLREHQEPEVGEGLIRAWPALVPSLRAPVVNLLIYRHAFHPALLSALEKGTLQVGELNLDLEHRRELLREAGPDIRRRAARFVRDEEYANRKAVVEQWLAKLPAKGDALKGRAVFERVCSPCHRVAGIGHAVGPDLAGVSHRSVEDLLSNILDPNMAINPAFVAYTAELVDGEQASGILAADSPAQVTLLQAQGLKIDIPRRGLKSLRASGRSLMPEGLEAGLTPQDLRDVIAFIQTP
jgi:putative membrane-bound dehydrogenase-like protein